MKELAGRLLQWLYQRSDTILPDEFAEQLLGAKIFFYTFGGALVGAAVERGANTIAGVWRSFDTTFWPDTISVILAILAGLLFALIGREIDVVDLKVQLRDSRGGDSSQELEDYRGKEEKKRYPKAKFCFLCAIVLLVSTIPVLLIGHKPPRAPEHPIIYFQCDPCTMAAGESARLEWDVEGATEAFLDGNRVPVRGYREVQPEQCTTYGLRAVGLEGNAETQVTVQVQEPPTPALTPNPRPSPTPTLTSTPKLSPSPTSADMSEPTPARETPGL